MTVKTHKVNYELSKSVYEECKHAIKVKECYNNIFNVTTFYTNEFMSGHWKVAYGYHHAIRNFYARHCFIINENNEVIDPTIYTRTNIEEENKDYVSFKIFDNVNTYFDALWVEDRQPALYSFLRDTETKLMIPWSREQKIILLG